MAANNEAVSELTRGLAFGSTWQDVEIRDGELFDPFFQTDIAFTETSDHDDYHERFTSDYNVPESVTSEQVLEPLNASASLFTVEELSLFDNTISTPASIVDGPSSVGQPYSWLSTPPSFQTTSTSPLLGKNERAHYGEFDLCEDDSGFRSTTECLLRGSGTATYPPSSNSGGSFHTTPPYIFNPFLMNSPHAFNALDVTASQAFENVGGWTNQPQIIEPVSDLDHAGAIPIPHTNAATYNNSFSSRSGIEVVPEEMTHLVLLLFPNQPSELLATIPVPNHHIRPVMCRLCFRLLLRLDHALEASL